MQKKNVVASSKLMPPQGTRKNLDGFAYNIDLILYNIKAQDLI